MCGPYYKPYSCTNTITNYHSHSITDYHTYTYSDCDVLYTEEESRSRYM
jgi:hypothetical protein